MLNADQHRAYVDALIDELHDLRKTREWDDDSQLRLLKSTTALHALLAASGIGECRRATPYSDMSPIYEANGTFHWCCRHDPPHCHP
jgi:hypothetical protein